MKQGKTKEAKDGRGSVQQDMKQLKLTVEITESRAEWIKQTHVAELIRMLKMKLQRIRTST